MEERARRSGSGRGACPAHLRSQARRGVRRVPAPARRRRGDGFRRPAGQRRQAVPPAPRRPRELPPAVPTHPRRRVPGHQRRPERARAAARRRPRQRHRRRRHGPVDLRLPRRRHAQHRAVRGCLRRRRHDGRARPELPQHADDPRRRQRRDRQQRRSQAEAPVDRRRARGQDRALLGGGRERRGALRRRDRPRPAQHRRVQLAGDGGAVPNQRPEPRRRGVADEARRCVQGRRWHAVLRPPRDP